MRWIDGLSKPQRVVVVVALGLALGAAGGYLINLGSRPFGWYAYSPITLAPAPDTGLPGWSRVILWLVVIGLWASASVRVLRPSSAGRSDKD